ncbi:hypothetical protein NYE69_33285 [Paenibacillus sp. FSL R5-0527]|uniref:hypothetical protein n=1 Tax=Paenibacillus sp. FSL R5-0527 TaxID=2975321 RepID=UPI00097B72F4|nr:hypothetical protein BK140_32935 [Paenibacillus macerans]
MQCKVPGCNNEANRHFAMVEVCDRCQLDLVDEAIVYYNGRFDHRPVFESIRHLTPWKKAGPGDKTTVTIAGIKNGQITSLRLGNDKFVIDRRNHYKGVKVL